MISKFLALTRTKLAIVKKTLGVAILAGVLIAMPVAQTAIADTAPPAGTPATVSADPLPTVQIDGIVWDQVTVGNTVYVTGRFSTARPAGVALGGAGSVTRSNLLAYDITTGVLDPTFVHSLGGSSSTPCTGAAATGPQGCSIAASPDGTTLYVGGTFSTVDGQPHANIAAFNLTNNTLISGFQGVNNKVKAVAATNTGVYIGGPFTSVAGNARGHLAYFNKNGTLNTGWNATVTGEVHGMVVAKNKLIFGGSFNAVNSNKFWSNAAVSLSTGASITPWASQNDSFPIHAFDPLGQSRTALTSASTDGTQVYFTSFAYIKTAADRPNTFEGRMAINADNGALVWLNDCAGDNYDSYPINGVLYSAGHMHSCVPRDLMPDIGSARTYYHAVAETTNATGTNTAHNFPGVPSYAGQPGSTILNWFPTFSFGSISGTSQAGWSVTGNANYISYAGEFPKVNGVAQQGIVRFGVAAVAPNNVGPLAYKANIGVHAAPANSSKNSVVKVYTTGDPDNGLLTYDVYRVDGTTRIATKTIDSRFWKSHQYFSFTDTNIPVGQSASYKVVITDPFGNSITQNTATVVDDTDARVTYAGTWTSVQNQGAARTDFGGGLHYTSVAGASYSYTFYGSAIELYGETYTNRGTSSVTIDGVAAGTINQYSTVWSLRQKLFSKSGLGFGKHTIKVTNTTAGKYMDIDAIYVNQDKVVDDAASSGVTYSSPSSWVTRATSSNATSYGLTTRYTTANNDSVTFTFTGNSVALMTEKYNSRGNMAISIDGGAPVTVSAYSTALQRQQIVFSKTGLTNGTHTMKVTKLSGAFMDVDAVFSR